MLVQTLYNCLVRSHWIANLTVASAFYVGQLLNSNQLINWFCKAVSSMYLSVWSVLYIISHRAPQRYFTSSVKHFQFNYIYTGTFLAEQMSLNYWRISSIWNVTVDAQDLLPDSTWYLNSPHQSWKQRSREWSWAALEPPFASLAPRRPLLCTLLLYAVSNWPHFCSYRDILVLASNTITIENGSTVKMTHLRVRLLFLQGLFLGWFSTGTTTSVLPQSALVQGELCLCALQPGTWGYLTSNFLLTQTQRM